MVNIFQESELYTSFDDIQNQLLKNKIIIIKNFIVDDFMTLRKRLLNFSKNNKETIEPKNHLSWHRYDNYPEKSSTKHLTHFFNFNLSRNYNLDIELYFELRTIFNKMILVQNAVANTKASLDIFHSPKDNNSIPFLHPQVIHYPRGSGCFDYHVHPFYPQKYGLILLLSKKGKDYYSGGTVIDKNQDKIDTTKLFQQGDLLIFKYNLKHKVTECDPGHDVNFDTITGRWTAILPFY